MTYGQNMYTESNACYRDSGGPLMCRRRTGEFYIKGVISWGPLHCGKTPGHLPLVFAKVRNLLERIHLMVKKEERLRMMV